MPWTPAMLRYLRWKLSLIYGLAAFGLVAFIGIGAYLMVRSYFQTNTDLALQAKLAQEFQAAGAPVPAELASAQQVWMERNPSQIRTPTPIPSTPTQASGKVSGDHSGSLHSGDDGSDSEGEDAYENGLSDVFTLQGTQTSQIAPVTSQISAPVVLNAAAAAAAQVNGSDWRTITLSNGSRVRLLTYRNDTPGGPLIFQAGRLLNDQDFLLKSFLTGLIALAAGSLLVISAGSWWLAGRTIGPAQQAWEQQQTFVSNASHELRTPLTLIRATAEVGLRQKPGPEQGQVLEEIVGETDYMGRLVDDLLLLSRLDTHRLALERREIELSTFLGDVLRQVQMLAGKEGVQATVGHVNGQAWGDPARLRQVLLILLDNAIRFTPSGGNIRLEASPSGKFVEITVHDTGAGIPAADMPHMFERFYQVRRPGREDIRSNGLGLSIARGLVEAMGGRIKLASREGQGTRVTVALPRV
jgi:signal transduction histidine kinase